MTSTDIYTNVGPFRGVPDNLARRIANLANAAAATVTAAAVREARAKSDEPVAERVYLQGPDMINRLDGRNFEHQQWQRTDAYRDIVGSSVFGAILGAGVIAAGFLVPAAVGVAGVAIAALIAAALVGAIARSSTLPALKALRDLRTQGYAAEYLPNIAQYSAGRCWLLGDDAIEIAETCDREGARVTSVFYDAIGNVRFKTDEGVEVVEIYSRCGGRLAILRSPVGINAASGGAHQLVEAITARAKTARRTA